MVFQFLANNLMIMFFLVFAYSCLLRYCKKPVDELLLGMVFSLIVWTAIQNGYESRSGIIFDCRSVVLLVIAMFGGPVTVILPTITAAITRISIGGAGALPGTILIFCSSAVGLAYYWWRQNKKVGPDKYLHFYIGGVIVHVIQVLTILLLPVDVRYEILQTIAPIALTLYPLATVLFCAFMIRQEKLIENEAALCEANIQLKTSQQQLTAANQQLYAANQQLQAANQQLRANEQKLNWLAKFPEENPSPVLRVTPDGRIEYTNPASEILLDELGAVNGMISNQYWKEQIANIYQNNKLTKLEMKTDGKVFSLAVVPVREYEYLNIYSMDISEQIQAEKDLAASDEKYEELVENVNSIIVRWGHEGKFNFINSYGLNLLGYSREELIGKPINTILPETDSYGENLRGLIEKILRNPEDYQNNENENVCKDGRRLWIRWANRAIVNENGNTVEIFAVGTDCTEEKKAEDIVKNYTKYMEQEVANRTAELSEKNQLLEKEINERIKAEKELKSAQAQMLESEKMVTIGRLASGIAHELNTPIGAIGSTNSTLLDGFKRHVNRCEYVKHNFAPYSQRIDDIINYMFDNPHRLLSSRERRAIKGGLVEKLSENGLENAEELASFFIEAGLYNNAEDYMDMFKSESTEEITKYLQEVSSIIQGMQVIDSAVNQASRITFALREYARTSKASEPERSSIRHTIETAIILYGNKIKHGIDLKLNLEEVPDIICNSNELIQVWSNLLHNSYQAMEGKGSMQIDVYQDGGEIVVKISDSGCGISQELLPKIFDPMFTTKPVGQGTGLGLDISKRIIDRHNGAIQVESQVDQGTTFTIKLPIRNSGDNNA